MARGRFRDLSRLQLASDDLIALTDALGGREHPIATAILGAVIVEHDLEQLLRARLKRKDHQTWARLTDERGPLNSFSSMIAMGYALGIYDQGMRSDLDIVRHIRNAFAHSRKPIHFDHPAVVAELKKATRWAKRDLSLQFKGRVDDKYAAQHFYAILCLRLSSKITKIEGRRIRSRTHRLERKTEAINLLLAGLPKIKR